MTKLKKVISGGQNGADQAGLRAARECGLETGGEAPKGFRTTRGRCPDLGRVFGLTEHRSPSYLPRTYANVRNSDATVRFATDFNSAGERCTLKAINQYDKPHFDIHVPITTRPEVLSVWLEQHGVETLNVAGNSDDTSPGIGQIVEAYLIQVFLLMDLPF